MTPLPDFRTRLGALALLGLAMRCCPARATKTKLKNPASPCPPARE
ncbi:hypothetical protein [Polaromonas sp.]|nr:hypothetical protein [Burkholderiales bacterium]